MGILKLDAKGYIKPATENIVLFLFANKYLIYCRTHVHMMTMHKWSTLLKWP